MKVISIAKNYSETPLGRYVADGAFSGETFREDYLLAALKDGPVTVQIDGTEGYGSSFLEEAFGGLVRKGHFTAEELHTKLTIESSDPDFAVYKKSIWKYIDEAKKKS